MTETAARFIELYRVIETELEARASGKPRRHVSAVMEYLSDAESQPVRQDLDVAREIRNIIIHNSDAGGNPVVEPSPGITDALSRVLDYIRKPPLALLFATPANEILTARMNDQLAPLLRAMLKRGFSHVPIAETGRLAGVFSAQTLLSYVSDNPSISINEDTRVSALAAYLPIEAHAPEQYRFIDERATFADVKLAFEERKERNARLAAVFITQTGEPDEPLLGMITPWDVLRRGCAQP